MLRFKMNCCPNPKCKKELEKLIIVDDNSTNPATFNFACPHCGFRLDPTTIQLFKNEEILAEEETETKRPETERETPSGCPRYLGYLNSGTKGSIILKECLVCPKMTDCMLYEK